MYPAWCSLRAPDLGSDIWFQFEGDSLSLLLQRVLPSVSLLFPVFSSVVQCTSCNHPAVFGRRVFVLFFSTLEVPPQAGVPGELTRRPRRLLAQCGFTVRISVFTVSCRMPLFHVTVSERRGLPVSSRCPSLSLSSPSAGFLSAMHGPASRARVASSNCGF